MEYKINGKKYKAILTDESDDTYCEYDIFVDEGLVGNVTKYEGEKRFSVWNTGGEKTGESITLKGAVEVVATILE